MKKLNLGCGYCIHPDWVNVDFVKTHEKVIAYNLLNGIPSKNCEFDVVYHSHLLEHFSKTDGIRFINECFRVLKPSGIIRITVPDLESIVLNYLKNLDGALKGDQLSVYNYEWIMLEMYDQTVRNSSGGDMLKYLYRDLIPNKEFVLSRIGYEGEVLHNNYLKTKTSINSTLPKTVLSSTKSIVNRLSGNLKHFFFNLIFRKEIANIKNELEALKIGKFRLSGEVHQWMYDRFSLGKLLKDCGFRNIMVVSAFESLIQNWNDYQLDSVNGKIRKPDSLFIEAVK